MLYERGTFALLSFRVRLEAERRKLLAWLVP